MNVNSIPTLDEVARIAAIDDPVMRNLQITQCYHELSAVLAARTGQNANWCTFATWASKQAGQTIRKEDLVRLLDSRHDRSPASLQSAERMAVSTRLLEAGLTDDSQKVALEPRNYTSAIDRASAAVARGNLKVFEEIGYAFARFYAICLPDESPTDESIARYCEALRPGDPPEGQEYLRRAFGHYYQALFEEDVKARAELILLANIEIGCHEQNRLQPEIAESLDSGLTRSLEFTRHLLARFFPFHGLIQLGRLYLMRLLGRPTALDQALRLLLASARDSLREALTEIMMTLTLPSGQRLRLGEDLALGFPASLQQIANPELLDLLKGLDPTPDSPVDSGATDWANLPERLHFIADLFRCYQEHQELLGPPFSPDQVAALQAGTPPAGRL
jgi:hypothetical protein